MLVGTERCDEGCAVEMPQPSAFSLLPTLPFPSIMWKAGLVTMAARLHEHSRDQIENNAGLRTLGSPQNPHAVGPGQTAHSISELWSANEKQLHCPSSMPAGWLAEQFLQPSIILPALVVVQTGSCWNCTACSERPLTSVRYDNHMKALGQGKPQSN